MLFWKGRAQPWRRSFIFFISPYISSKIKSALQLKKPFETISPRKPGYSLFRLRLLGACEWDHTGKSRSRDDGSDHLRSYQGYDGRYVGVFTFTRARTSETINFINQFHYRMLTVASRHVCVHTCTYLHCILTVSFSARWSPGLGRTRTRAVM